MRHAVLRGARSGNLDAHYSGGSGDQDPAAAKGKGPRIYVGGIPTAVSETMVRGHFNQWGQVLSRDPLQPVGEMWHNSQVKSAPNLPLCYVLLYSVLFMFCCFTTCCLCVGPGCRRCLGLACRWWTSTSRKIEPPTGARTSAL